MKLSLLGRARYLDRTTGRPCPPVRTTLFQPIAFVKRLVNKNSCGLVIAVGSLISLFLIAGPAVADPYKWCAAYRNGGNNCGFTTIEQCRASVSGVGGTCEPNQFYTGPDKTSAQRSQKQAQRKPPAEHRARFSGCARAVSPRPAARSEQRRAVDVARDRRAGDGAFR